MKRFIWITWVGCFLSALAQGQGPIKVDVVDKKAADTAAKAVREAKDGPDVDPVLRTPQEDTKIEQLRQMIIEGTKNGLLNPSQSFDACRELETVSKLEAQMRRSGNAVTPVEHRILNNRLDELHEKIWKMEHDGPRPSAATVVQPKVVVPVAKSDPDAATKPEAKKPSKPDDKESAAKKK